MASDKKRGKGAGSADYSYTDLMNYYINSAMPGKEPTAKQKAAYAAASQADKNRAQRSADNRRGKGANKPDASSNTPPTYAKAKSPSRPDNPGGQPKMEGAPKASTRKKSPPPVTEGGKVEPHKAATGKMPKSGDSKSGAAERVARAAMKRMDTKYPTSMKMFPTGGPDNSRTTGHRDVRQPERRLPRPGALEKEHGR